MRQIYFQRPLTKQQKKIFEKEFFNWSALENASLSEPLDDVEVFFGETFDLNLFNTCPKLKWIHLDSYPDWVVFQELCKKKELLVTINLNAHIISYGEYLLHSLLTGCRSTRPITLLSHKKILLLGDNPYTLKLAELLTPLNPEIILFQETPCFRPYFSKLSPISSLKSALPHADFLISCLCYHEKGLLLNEDVFSLLKPESVAIFSNSLAHLKIKDLINFLENLPIKQCFLDLPYRNLLPKETKLHERVVLTVNEAKHPALVQDSTFFLFLNNLRFYLLEDLGKMEGNYFSLLQKKPCRKEQKHLS